MSLDIYTYVELKNMASRMDLKVKGRKNEYISAISNAFKEYENYKNDTLERYSKIKQLGNEGKDGITYCVKRKGRYFAMKMFKYTKNIQALKNEIYLQSIASKHKVCPKLIDYDTVFRYIIMEKMDTNLFDIMKDNGGKFLKEYQLQIIHIFNTLDKIKIFHNDPNPCNFMVKKDRVYIIDFGMGKYIDNSLIKKLKTDKPNMKLMIPGLILQIRSIFGKVNCNWLLKHVSVEDRQLYNI